MAKSPSQSPTLNLSLDDLTSENPAMRRCLALAREGAKSELPILLQGETGTGKTLLAQAIHNSSPRKVKNFLSFNASAMSDTLLESQLFGHEKGSFTGATARMRGKFEMANDGTLFFDEIADMSGLAQAKILRAVEYGEYERLGSEVMHYADVRIISATNRPLRNLVRDGLFREDLYHRLNGLTLVIPPLRERKEDLPGMIAMELHSCAQSAGKSISAIEPDAFQMLLDYSWPGNLRELHRVIQAIVLFTEGDTIYADDVILDEDDEPLTPYPVTSRGPSPRADFSRPHPLDSANLPTHFSSSQPTLPPVALPNDSDLTLETALLKHVAYVYELMDKNKRKTAQMLNVSRSTLDRKLESIDARMESNS